METSFEHRLWGAAGARPTCPSTAWGSPAPEPSDINPAQMTARTILGLFLAILTLGACDVPENVNVNFDTDDASVDTDIGDSGPTCAGCLQDGICLPGTEDRNACGFGGGVCAVCGPGMTCLDSACQDLPECTPDNCLGCCLGDVCMPGIEDSACGSQTQCDVCDGSSTCDQDTRVCVLSCAETCQGCCLDDGTCIPVDIQGPLACGRMGAECASCKGFGSDAECLGGMCASPTCSDTCNGCCSYLEDDPQVGKCELGTSDTTCGAGGTTCVACATESGQVCGSEGLCEGDPEQAWDVVLLQGAIVKKMAPGGGSWDPFGDLPDPFVTVAAGGLVFTTPSVPNTLTPVWNQPIVTGVLADEIPKKMKISVFDSDPKPATDQLIGECPVELEGWMFGTSVWETCEVDGRPIWFLQFRIDPSEG